MALKTIQEIPREIPVIAEPDVLVVALARPALPPPALRRAVARRRC